MVEQYEKRVYHYNPGDSATDSFRQKFLLIMIVCLGVAIYHLQSIIQIIIWGVAGSFAILGLLWIMKPKLIDIHYEKNCKVCRHRRIRGKLNPSTHAISEIDECARFQSKNQNQELKNFKPCAEYELSRCSLVEQYNQSKKKKNKKRRVKKNG